MSRKYSRLLRSSVLTLFLSRPFLEEILRDIPIFFSFFPARSFGIELEYNGGVLRKIPEICLRFSGSAHFSKRGKAEKTEDLQGQIWNKKRPHAARKSATQGLKFLDFLGRSQDAQMCLFRAVRGYLRFPMTAVLFPLA